MESYPRCVLTSPLSADKSMNRGGGGGGVVVVVVVKGVDARWTEYRLREPDQCQDASGASRPTKAFTHTHTTYGVLHRAGRWLLKLCTKLLDDVDNPSKRENQALNSPGANLPEAESMSIASQRRPPTMLCPHQLCKAPALVSTSRMIGSKKLHRRQGGCGRCGAITTPFQVPRPQSGGRSTAHKADLGDTPMLHLQPPLDTGDIEARCHPPTRPPSGYVDA